MRIRSCSAARSRRRGCWSRRTPRSTTRPITMRVLGRCWCAPRQQATRNWPNASRAHGGCMSRKSRWPGARARPSDQSQIGSGSGSISAPSLFLGGLARRIARVARRFLLGLELGELLFFLGLELRHDGGLLGGELRGLRGGLARLLGLTLGLQTGLFGTPGFFLRLLLRAQRLALAPRV